MDETTVIYISYLLGVPPQLVTDVGVGVLLAEMELIPNKNPGQVEAEFVLRSIWRRQRQYDWEDRQCVKTASPSTD